MTHSGVVLDTNVFVAAGFNPNSHSAQIIETIREGALRLVWNEATRRETRRILQQIPPLAWEPFAGLFREEGYFDGDTRPERFDYVSDPDDRKFAALAAASGATLITQDEDLLAHRSRVEVTILTAEGYLQRP